MKDSFTIELSEYAVENWIASKPAFLWWVPCILKKREQIISKLKTKYWHQSSKYGIKVPISAEEAQQLYHANGNTLLMDALQDNMKTVWPAFKVFEGAESGIPKEYQRIRCHIIWDIKLGENFQRNA